MNLRVHPDAASELEAAVDWYDDHLYEIAPDASAVLDAVIIGDSCWQLVVDPDGEYIYVTDRGTDQVRVIDQETLSLHGDTRHTTDWCSTICSIIAGKSRKTEESRGRATRLSG